MVNDDAFKDFLAKSITSENVDEETRDKVNEASLYSQIMMEKAVIFLKETHSISETIYIANLLALILASSDDLDSAIRCARIISDKLIMVDQKFAKSE